MKVTRSLRLLPVVFFIVVGLGLAACRGSTPTASPAATADTPTPTATSTATTADNTSTPTIPPAATATATPTVTAQPTPPPALSQAVERIHELMPGVRGLEFKRDTPPSLMTSQELNAYLSERVTEENR